MLRLAMALLAPAGLHGAPASSPPAPSIELSPQSVQMGAFYAGARVRIEGTTPPGTDVVVVIRGAEEAELFNRKARVGPVWVNVDRVHVTRVPSLFIRLGGGDVRSLLDPAGVEAYQLDDSAIEKRMSCRVHCKCRVGGPTPPGSGRAVPDRRRAGRGLRRADPEQLFDPEGGGGHLPGLPRRGSSGRLGVGRDAVRGRGELAKEGTARLVRSRGSRLPGASRGRPGHGRAPGRGGGLSGARRRVGGDAPERVRSRRDPGSRPRGPRHGHPGASETTADRARPGPEAASAARTPRPIRSKRRRPRRRRSRSGRRVAHAGDE